MKLQITPNGFELFRFTPDELRQKMVGEKPDDRRASRPDRVAVARPHAAVGIVHAQDDRLLTDEFLNRVGPFDLRFERNEEQFGELNTRHADAPLLRGGIERP
jgi:hypothetical protein